MACRILLMLLALAIFAGCNSLTECEEITSREAIMLIDVTDEHLFADITTDLNANLPVFMQRTGLSEITPCQSFTLTLVPITAREGLEAVSETISITRKGQSYQAERQQASPAPLVSLLKTQLASYEHLTRDEEITSGSSIANVMLKALTRTNPDAEITLIVFSDMIENNRYLNMYRHVPDSAEIQSAASTLIDPLVLESFRNRQREGLDASVLIVCKDNPLAQTRTNAREIRHFWSELLHGIGVDDVRFLDNLSNINQL